MSGSAPHRQGAAVRRAVLGVLDQICYSVTNFALTIVVAHFSDGKDFGAYALLYASFLVASGINRGLVCEPLIIRYSTVEADTWQTAAQTSLRRSVSFGLVAGAVFAGATAFAPGAFRPVGFIFAISLWLMFAQDCLRYAALARGKPTAALANDATVLVIQAALTVLVVVGSVHSPSVIVGVWVVSSGVGALIALRFLRLRVGRTKRLSLGEQHSRLANRLAADNAVVLSAQQGVAYILAAVAGLAAAGGLRAAQTVFAPLTTLNVGLQSAVVPELVRLRQRSVLAMRRAMVQVGVGLAGVGVVFVVAAPLVPDSFGTDLFGPSWQTASPLLGYVGLSVLVAIPTSVSQAGLRAMADARRTLQARLIGVTLFAGVTIPFAAALRTEGAGIGLAVGSAAQSVVWVAFFRLSYQHNSQLAQSSHDPGRI